MQRNSLQSSQSDESHRLPRSGEAGSSLESRTPRLTGRDETMGGARRSRSRRASREAQTRAASPLGSELRDRFGLTPMEAVVACALADGLTYEEIAYRCSISYHTVHSHVKAIHQKTGVSSNGKLLALIRREGWR